MKTSKNKLQDYGPVLMSTQVIVVAFKGLYRNVSAPYCDDPKLALHSFSFLSSFVAGLFCTWEFCETHRLPQALDSLVHLEHLEPPPDR